MKHIYASILLDKIISSILIAAKYCARFYGLSGEAVEVVNSKLDI